MSGATVSVNEASLTAQTNAIGAYSFALPPGTYTVTASQPTYQYPPVTSAPMAVVAGGRTTVPPIALQGQNGTLTGLVLSGGAPVPGARVTLAPQVVSPFGGTATTQADGSFSLTLAQSNYNLLISKAGFASYSPSFGVSVSANQTTNVGTINLSTGGTITGFVRNSVTSAGIKGASVTWGGSQAVTTTDVTGRFVMNVPPGTSAFSVTAAGFVNSWSSASFTVTVGQTTTTTDMILTPSAAFVTGRVVLDVGGDAVLGAQVQTSAYTATTDGTGAFVVPMSPGTNVLTIRKTGYGDLVSAPITAALGATVDAGTFSLVQGAIVTGVVVDASTGAAVASATVTTAGTAGAGYSLGDGRFTLYSGSGLRTFTASKAGYIPTTTPSYDVVPGSSLDLGQIPIAPGVSVTGTIVDAATQSPIAGASVTFLGTTNSVTTNASGQFAISGIPGLNALMFANAGYTSSTSLVFGLSAGSPAALGTTYLSPLATVTGTLSTAPGVTVRVKGTGISTTTNASGAFTLSSPAGALTIQAVEGAMVVYETAVNVAPGEIRNLGTLPGTAYFVTNGYTSSGAFRIPTTLTAVSGTASCSGLGLVAVPAGTYTVTASSPGWLSQTFGPYTVAAGAGRSVGDSFGNLYFTRAGSLVGTVTDATTGAPLPGASVVAGSASAVTDAYGNFLLSLAAGSYPLTVSKSGYAGTTTASQTVVVGDERSAGIIALTAQLALPGTVIGTVVNAAGGSPLAGASVSLAGLSGSVTTDASGAFSIQGAPGSYSVVVIKAGWAAFATAELAVGSGTTTNASAIAFSNVSGTVTGTVIDAATLSAVAGATVSVSGTPISCTTDPSGNFLLSLSPGPYALTASKDGWFAPATAAFSVAASGSVNVGSLWMSRNATIFGRVVNSYGGAGVFGVLAQAGGAKATTDASGAFRALVPSTNSSGVKTGPVSLSLSRDNWPGYSTGTIYPVPAGGSTDAGVLTMTGTGRIGGQLYYANTSELVAGATVSVTDTSNSVVTSGTSAPITFFLAQAPGDNYTLTVQKAGALDLVTAPFNLRSGQFYDAGKLRIARPISVSGTIYDSSSGAAIPSVTVTVNPQGLTTTTNGNGIYSLYVNPGQVTFVLSKTGYPTKSIPTFIDPSTLGYPAENFYLDPPNSVALSSLTFDVASLNGGGISNLTTRLTKAAPPVGATVSLSSSDRSLLFFQTPYGSVGDVGAIVPGGQTFGVLPAYTAAVTHDTSVTVTGSYGGVTKTATLTLLAPPASLAGVAPGWVVPGDTTPVLYGSGIQAGSTVTFTGPVYSLTDVQNPLCSVGGTCPSSALAATVDTGGAYAAFAIPANAAPGIYHLKVRTAAGIDSTNNHWIAVDAVQRTFAAVPGSRHNYASRIYPGQTITGTLTGDVPLSAISDYNSYYFVATAGTHLSVTMQRVDMSIPWENPASLDPQIEVIAPDGFIYANLQGFDNVPGSDLNASILDAILPQTGVYIIAAETLRGSGQYNLTFNLSSVAPAPAGSRVLALSGGGATVPLNRSVTANALMLDPRGYPVAGADVTFAVQSSPDDTGALSFVGGSAIQTSLQGIAVETVRITAAGKVRFRPSFTNPVFSNAAYTVSADPSANALAVSDHDLVIPLYRPAARRPFRILGIDSGRIALSEHEIKRLAPERVAIRHDNLGVGSPSAVRAPLTNTPASSTGGLAPTPKAEPRALAKPAAYVRIPLAITGCAADPSLFVEAGVNAPEVYPPFTVTLTDMTPPTGGGAAPRAIDFQGIRDHRIEKKVRTTIDIKDGLGATPAYPVLVQLALGGPRHGQLILDPDGAKITCDEASFLWHDVGNSNEQFDYKLGTLSLFAGVDQDPSGATFPVWDEAETLAMRISTIDAGGTETQWESDWAVRPEPGKPDHFACYEPDGSVCPDTFRFWSGYQAYAIAGHMAAAPYIIYSAYELDDKYGNKTYGYSGASMSAPASNVTSQFFDQLPGMVVYGVLLGQPDFGHYGIASSWTNVPAWPNGSLPSTLEVDYSADPDGEWPSGSVTKDITYQFEDTNSHALVESRTYDLVRPDGSKGVTDGVFPMTVRPAMTAANMPKTEAGDTRRLTLLIVSGNVTRSDSYYAEPYSAGTRLWSPTSETGFRLSNSVADPKLELTDAPAFRFTLIDSAGLRVTDGSSFRVYRCPRYDHESQNRTCSTNPVDSANGLVDNFHVNEGGDYRGYVGFELTKAPVATGEYFIKAESLGQNYRVRRQGDFVVVREVGRGEWIGAFSIAVVDDPVADCNCETCNEQCTASPNFIGTGTYQARATDLTLPTAGFPLQVSRRYLSSNHKVGALGLGWTTSLESRIWFSSYIAGSGFAAQVANVLLPGGEQFRFTAGVLAGTFLPPTGRHDNLVRNSDGTFDFTVQRSRTIYRFDKGGRLKTMTDEFGNAVAITYNAAGQAQRVADQAGSGRYIDVSWREDGKVDYIQDSAGRRVSYGYAADGTLTSATDPANRVTHYHYTNGSYGPLLDQISDNWNRVLTVVTYDAGDRTKSYSEHLETYTYTYVNPAATTKTDSAGNTSMFTTAPSGQITVRTPPSADGSAATRTDYNADGSVSGTTDEMGVRTTYTYDANGRVATVTRDATGTSPVRFEYTYDPAFPDKVTSVTPKNPGTGAFDSNWQGWRYDYFPAAGTLNHVYRLKSDGASTDGISTFAYDSHGRVTSQTTATNAVTDYAYTGADLATVTHPSNNDSGTRPVTAYGNYDSVGRPRTVTDPAGKDTTYTYDALGRVLTVTLPKPTSSFPNDFTTTYAYDNFDPASGLVFTNITDPNGRTTKLGYDEHGRLLKSVDAAKNTTTYAYNRDVLASITDANDNVTSYHYDPLKRLDKTTFPDGKLETYTYYPDGLLKTKTDRMGQTLTYEYDAFKRLKKKTYPNSTTITYTYQGQKLMQVDDAFATPAETHTFTYDSSYRIRQNVQGPRGTLSYTYTPDDRVDTMTIAGTPNVTTAHTYYADGSLNAIAWSPQAGQFKYAYTPRGQYQTVTFPNGQTRTYSYDDQGRLTSLANALGATNIATFAYGYDVDWATGLNTMLGQRVSMTATVPSQGFTNALTKYSYDPLYQLTKAAYPNAAPFNGEVDQWTYDAIGNRLTNQINAAIQNYTYEKIGANPKNAQKLLGDGTNTYTYDLNGSQTSRRGPANYGFVNDPDNRLASISGNETASYTYDYQGRRTSKTVAGVTTKYLYDGLNLISETTAAATTQYVFGPGIDEPLAAYRAGAISYVDVDGLGSTVAENDAIGTLLHSSIFDVWGVTKTETGMRFSAFGYTSREFAEAGLWFYRARQLQPTTGRFTQEDPLASGNGPNRYSYAQNRPSFLVDPDGKSVSLGNPKERERRREALVQEILESDLPGKEIIAGLIEMSPQPSQGELADDIRWGAWAPVGGMTICGRTYVKHHLFSQRADLARLFARAGIDIHEFLMIISEAEHKAVHAGAARGGLWNAAWTAFFDVAPDANRAQILAQLKKMIEVFQLTGPIIPR